MRLFSHGVRQMSNKYLLNGLFIFLILSSASVSKAEVIIDNFSFSEETTVDAKKLFLNGTAFRKASLFNVKIWLAGLYLESKSNQSDEILSSPSVKMIRIFPLYNISASDSIKGWKVAFADNCENSCQTLSEEIKRFLLSVPEFKKKDEYVYTFSKDGVYYSLNSKEVFKSNNLAFARLLLATWIGKKPPTDEVRKGLLSLK